MDAEIVWRLRDKAALMRSLRLLFPGAPEEERAVDDIYRRFSADLQLHPVEWPTSAREPSEHTWSFGRIAIRYRFIPSGRIAEVLSVGVQ